MTNVITPQDIDSENHRSTVELIERAEGDPLAQLAIQEAGGHMFGDAQEIEDGPDVGAPPIPVAKRN